MSTQTHGRADASPNERRARLVGGPADGHVQVINAERDGSWPQRIRSDPTSDPQETRSAVYQLTPNPTAEGDLVYEVEPDLPSPGTEAAGG